MGAVDITKLEAYKTMPTSKSKDIEWVHWMNLLNRKYGSSLATELFLDIWVKRGSSAANTVMLRQYLEKKFSIKLDESVLDNISDVGSGIGHFVGGVFKVGKVAFFAIGGILLVGIGITVISVARKSGSIVEGVVKAKTGG